MKYKVGIITASDKGAKGERVDESGKLIQKLMEEAGYEIIDYCIIQDEEQELVDKMISQSDVLKANLILTTGGTGFSMRDHTPEATLKVIDRQTPGISEAIRAYSMQITKRAMLSRAVSGIRNTTLIINLPGSPKAVRESLEYILPELEHGIGILTGEAFECGRK